MRAVLTILASLLLPAPILAAGQAASVVSDPVVIVAALAETPSARQETVADPSTAPPLPQRQTEAGAPAQHGPVQEVVMQALALLGTPYRWGGQSPGGGFDCSGLVSHVVEQALGIALPRSADAMSRVGAAIERSALRAGDLLFFITRRKEVSHVGIYVGEGRFVHATRTGGDVRVSALEERYWASRYVGARRIAGE